MAEIKNTFGKLDQDKAPQFIQDGDYQYALNIRNSGSTGGQVGVIEPIAGNLKKEFPLPSGENICIGYYSHEEANRIYYFIYNSLGEHQIIRFNYGSLATVFEVILRTPELNFQNNSKIVEAQIIGYVKDSKEGQLFFNDALNEVRRLDIEECRLFVDDDIWEFEATKIEGGFVQLEGTTPPPFAVGDTITIVRDWRGAWVDHQTPIGVPDYEDGRLASFHSYDPNPEYSGEHQITAITGNTITLDVADTGVTDYVQAMVYPDEISYIGGKAYTYNANRKFTLPFQEDYIKLYRANPPFPVYGRYNSDETRKTNSLRGHLFQFKTRYIYENGMRSVPSPINDIIIPSFNQNVPFANVTSWIDNCIDLWFDTGGHDVVAVELLAREVSATNSDWASVRIFQKDEIDTPSHSSHSFRFYGDEVRVTIPVAEGTQPMDYIPHVGKAFCFIKDKRNAIGACEEGFDHVDAEMEVETFDQLDVARTEIVLSLPNVEETTESELPVSETIDFPLNRDNDERLTALWTTSSGGEYSLFKAFISPMGLPVFSFSEDSPVTDIFPSGWLNSDDFSFFGSDVDGGYVRVQFELNYTGFVWSFMINPPAGAVISMTVGFRVSRHLFWMNRTPPVTPGYDTRIFELEGPTIVADYGGVLSYDNFDGGLSYHDFEDTFTFTCTGSETLEDVRNYFIDQILTSDGLSGEVEVTLARFGEEYTGGSNVYESKVTTVTVGVDADAWNPSSTTPGIEIRPTVSVASFALSDQGTPANVGTVSLLGLAHWFGMVGVNRTTVEVTADNPDGERGFKTGAKHPIVIEYRDSVGRRATVTKPVVHYIPYFNEPGITYNPYSVTMLLRIFSNAPSWATHYQLMYAGNATMQDWITYEVDRVNQEGDTINIALSNRLIKYNKQNNGEVGVSNVEGRSNLSYSWSPGDRLRFITYWGGTEDAEGDEDDDVPAEFVDVEIIGEGTNEDYGLMLIVDSSALLPYVSSGAFGSGSLVEVYTPKNSTSDDQVIYQEIGQAFKITGTQHHGNRFNQGSTTPGSDSPYAEILLKNTGDAYTIGRVKIESADRSRNRIVESSSLSDFYYSYGWGGGVANRYNPEAKRAWKKELIRYSDFILGDKNGLNRYFDGNVSDEPDVLNGFIQRMECPEDRLYVFQELGTGMMQVRALELTSATGSSMIMRSDNVLGNINYIPGNLGIGKHRESLAYWAGVFYFPSIQNGLFLRLAGSEITPISKFGLDDFWNKISDYMKRQSSHIPIYTAFDPKYGELVVHIIGFVYIDEESDFNLSTSPAITLAYSEAKKGWVTEYSFHPEFMGNHANRLISWKNGQLYLHDRTENWNQFYDGIAAEDSKIKLVFNERPQAVKFLQAIGIMMNDDVVEPKEVVISSPYKGGQRTSLFAGDFEYQEDQFFAAVMQNELTPDVEDPIINGDDMRGQYFLVELTFGVQSKFELFAVSLEHKPSEKTIKTT